MSRWVKFVALFLMTFALFDVCTPEVCTDDVTTESAPQLVADRQTPDGGAGCQFEEDCIACAHILPMTHFEPQVLTVVAPYAPDLHVDPLDGISFIPYLPPRA